MTIVRVTSGGIPVTESATGYPYYEADNGFGIPVTFGSTGIPLGRAVASGGGGGTFVPDAAPSAYRTTTQTAIMGRTQQAAGIWMPPIASEFSVSTWLRCPTGLGSEALVINAYDPDAVTGADACGGGTSASLCVYWSGSTPATTSQKSRFYISGVDKDGNKLSATTVPILNAAVNVYGYATDTSFAVSANLACLLTAQYRSGNIELWITYRGMAPRLLVQQACTWNGFARPHNITFGGGNASLSSSGTLEFEMPIVLRTRSLSQNEIAQLADGVSPEQLNTTSGYPEAALRFANVIDGTTTVADRAAPSSPADGKTITLNGTVYTFRTSPTLTTDLQTYVDVSGTMTVDATADTITFAGLNMPNGRRVAFDRTVTPSGLDPQRSYYVVNSAVGSIQLSKTLGGAPVDILVGGAASSTISSAPAVIDALCTQLNALTSSTGGASDATYVGTGSDLLWIVHRTAGSGGTSFTFDCNATSIKMPTNKRLAHGVTHPTNYLNYTVGPFGSPGLVRRRSSAWTVPSGAELAPNTQVTGSMRVNAWTDAMVTNSVGGTSYLSLSGIYTGNDPVSGGQIKFYDQNGGTQVQDFTAFSSFSYNAATKTWSGKLTAPAGKRWISCEQKKTGSTQVSHRSEARFGFGKIIAADGRSHCSDWFNDYTANDIAPNGFCSQFTGTGMPVVNGYYQTDNCWHPYDTALRAGAGVTVFTNAVSNALNVCVGIISYALGGVSFASQNDPALWAYRQTASQQNWGDASLMPLVDASFLTHSGEDFGTPASGLFSQWRANIDTYFGANCKFGLVSSLTAKNSPDGTVGIGTQRGQMVDYINYRLGLGSTKEFYGGSYQYESNTGDGIHASAIIDHKVKCETHAIGYLGAQSGNYLLAMGPYIQSAVRSGATIDITWNLNGATALQVPLVADITGLDVALASASFTPILAPVAVDATTDVITHASNTFNDGDPIIIFTNAGTMPGGVTYAQKVYVRDRTSGSYKVAATLGGVAINITSNGTNVYVSNVRDLLTQSSHTITGANTTRVVLAADPGAAVHLLYRWGRPGNESSTYTGASTSDPIIGLGSDAAARTTMTQPWNVAQSNPLNDNYARTYATATTLGRLAEMNTTAVVVT